MNITDELERDLLALTKKDKKISKLFSGKKKIQKSIERNLSNHNFKMTALPLKYGKENVLEIKLKADKFGHQSYSRNEIQTLGNDLSHQLSEDGIHGLLTTSIEFNEYWRNGRNISIGDDVNLYQQGEYDKDDHSRLGSQNKFKEFRFYVMRTQKAYGGESINNDCMYDCLLLCLGELFAKTPEDFKKFLKLNRNDRVGFKHIPLIENKIKMAINVTGQWIYTSSYKGIKQINLKLYNGHYTVDDSQTKRSKQTVSTKEHIILLHDKTNRIGYDGIGEIEMNRDMLNKIYHYKTNYIIIPKSQVKLTINEEYDEIIKNNNELKEATNGFINFEKTGTIKQTCLHIFEKLSKCVVNPEEITQLEMVWLEKSTCGAIIFNEIYEGPAYKFDVKSMYPSIMKSGLLIPVKRGRI